MAYATQVLYVISVPQFFKFFFGNVRFYHGIHVHMDPHQTVLKMEIPYYMGDTL